MKWKITIHQKWIECHKNFLKNYILNAFSLVLPSNCEGNVISFYSQLFKYLNCIKCVYVYVNICNYLAAPFCKITFPLCKWPCKGKPRSLRKSNASSICRPKRWTCVTGKPFGFRVYLRDQGSFHWAYKEKINKNCWEK